MLSHPGNAALVGDTMKPSERALNALKRRAAGALFMTLAVSPLSAPAAQSVPETCSSQQDRVAAVRESYPYDYPAIAVAAGLRGSAVVRIALTRAGHVTDAAIAHSSGFGVLDDKALQVARLSTYKPETVACQAVDGQYLLVVFDE